MPTWLRVALFVFNVSGLLLCYAAIRLGGRARVVGWVVAVMCAVAIGFRLGEGF
jgi:hypothetical protein